MNWIPRKSIILLAVLTLAACDSSEERAEKHFQSGLALLEEGDVARAMVEFRNVLALNASHKDARLTYARQARSTGNVAESYSNFLYIAEQFPDDLEARLALTEMSILHLNWDEAERHGAALIQANAEMEGQDVIELALEFRKAVVDKDAPRMRELTRQAEALFSEQPDDQILHRILIEGYMAENQFSKAIEVTDRAIAAAPDNTLYYRVKTRLLSQLGDVDEMAIHLRRTIELFPDDDASKGELIRLLVSEGDNIGAENFLRSQVESADDKVKAHISLISVIRDLRGTSAALEETNAAIDLYENDTVLRALKAGIMFDLGDGDAAVEIMQGVVDSSEPGDETDRFRVALARMLEATGNEVGARQLVEAVLARDAGQVEALKMSARWMIEGDETDQAIATLRRALDQEPEDAEALTLMARAHERNGDQQLAQDLLALAVEASRNAPAESLRFAQILIRQERYTSAEDVLVNALRRDPGNLRLLTRLGGVYLLTEEWSRAMQVETTLRNQDSQQARLAANDLRMQIISRRDGPDRGMEFLKQLVEDDGTGSIAAKVAMINARLAEDRGEEALQLARELTDELPDDPKMRLVLGNTQLALEDFAAAENTFRGILETSDDGIAAMQLVRSLGAQGRSEEAVAVLDEMLVRLPDNYDLLWAKASFLERDNEIDAAIEIYEHLYTLNTDSQVIANNLASLLATYREDDESLERAYSVGRRLRGTDVAPFQDTIGWILFRRGQVDEAITYLEPAAEVLGGDPIVIYHLAKAYAAIGRDEQALETFRRALEVAGASDEREQFIDAAAEIERLSSAAE